MRFLALATDYDGTLARGGVVSKETVRALERFRQSGRKLIMVTGRVLSDLESVFPRVDLFDVIVAENGAVLSIPSKREKHILAKPPKAAFVERLRQRGVRPIEVGDVIVATASPCETTTLEVIRDLGLELQVIFNKGSVMVLPSGVNKRTGLDCALECMGLSEHNVVGVGDAENDHAFLSFCEFSAAVANALPSVKETADFTTKKNDGEGVVELIEMMLRDDLAAHELEHRGIPIGYDGPAEIRIPAYRSSVLVAGASGSGKSTFVAGLLETLIEKRFQVCLIDPEGDYGAFSNAITLGDEEHSPSLDEVFHALKKPASQVIANLIGTPLRDRPGILLKLLPRLQEMRLKTGRPHWIIIDEAHHMLPREWAPPSMGFAVDFTNVVLITVHPEHVSPLVLSSVDTVFAVGRAPETVIENFAKATGMEMPAIPAAELPADQALAWFLRAGDLRRITFYASQIEQKRHKRKYAFGEIDEDRTFYFRGPQKKLNLKAQNLITFVQLAEGLDDETWLYHLRCGDYSKWFRRDIKDEELADEVAQIEQDGSLDARASRQKIKHAIEQRYTAPA